MAIASAIAALIYSSGTGPVGVLIALIVAFAIVVVIWIVSLVGLARALFVRTWTVLTTAGVLQARAGEQWFVRWDQFDPELEVQATGEGEASSISLPLRSGGSPTGGARVSGDLVISGAADVKQIVEICRARIAAAEPPRATRPAASAADISIPLDLVRVPLAVADIARSEQAEFVVRSARRVPLKQTAIAMGFAIAFAIVGLPLAYMAFTTTDPHGFALRVGTVLFAALGLVGIVANTIDLVRAGPYYVGTPAQLIEVRGGKVARRPWSAFAGDIRLTTGRTAGTVTLTLRGSSFVRIALIGIANAERVERICRRHIDEFSAQ
jgi:cytochrome c biogenesis protein CcdA